MLLIKRNISRCDAVTSLCCYNNIVIQQRHCDKVCCFSLLHYRLSFISHGNNSPDQNKTFRRV